MDISQEFEIISTQKPKIFITTTGISEIEKKLIRENLPKHIILEDELNTLTSYLVSYKSIITDKMIQAMAWSIKIINISWLYDFDSSPKKYEMKPFEGIEFSSSDMTNEIFNNYFKLLGGVYNENLTISTGFFVTKDTDGDKIDFCKKYNIPVINPDDSFKNNYKLFYKDLKINAFKSENQNIFYDKVFFIDDDLPKSLFNLLKRYIIEYEGTRVSIIDNTVDFIVSNSFDKYKSFSNKIVHYQYVFDCVEYHANLIPGNYFIYQIKNTQILKNVICCIEKSFIKDSFQVINKLRSLGAIIKDSEDFTCTHMIIKDKREYTRRGIKPYKIVSSEWIDQCLYTLKHIREDKYLVRDSTLNLFSSKSGTGTSKKIKCSAVKEKVFQFTGLPSFLRNKVIEVLDKYNIKYVCSDRYEQCTHLIMGDLNTSEKFISSLCNGAWILRPDFIDSFDNSLHFEFEKYEWCVDETTVEKDRKIIQSIKKWREKVAKCEYPAFHKWIVKLYAEEPKKTNYKRVIENGGGRMTDGEHFTHCFVAKNYKSPVIEKVKYSTDYIFSYLFK